MVIPSQIGAVDKREKARQAEESAHLTRAEELEAKKSELMDAMYVWMPAVSFTRSSRLSTCTHGYYFFDFFLELI